MEEGRGGKGQGPPLISHDLIELTRLLPVTSCIVDSAAIYIMVAKF
jgi:hypothetical protein